ncbi:MAG TPA: D-alanyl-D-alanine carboxypeptidase/D-alanyl-D-alanine-endopeptidase [Tepidisphaeraceae bacterium]|jgi:D-alanyl-D-alanine carboxypeptidase/D-alanyl-D-alanine-endopeptidase (penicillin-binding protein 4)|nr:D-alanyl-D-alanine carboxypeptidase/D-alanyl-D-alanine-endopeptidase [Tepidisphaeraceae bacterium]
MGRLAFFVFTFSLCLLTAFSAANADLATDVDSVLRDKLLDRAAVGIDIVRLGKSAGDVTAIYQSDSKRPLVPASNLKVVTTSAALEQLGPDFKFRTLLLYHDGDLVLVGDGDPTLGDAELLKKVGWDVDTVFKTWAEGLAKRKFSSARDLLVDDSVFDEEFLHPDWPADQVQKRYDAEIAGLNLNANCVDVYVRPGAFGRPVDYRTDPATSYVSIKNTCTAGGENAVWLSREPGTNELVLRGTARSANVVPVSVTIHDPPMFAGAVLAERLRSAGISLTGTVKRDRAERQAYLAARRAGSDSSWALLAVHETPLLSVIDRANKDSMNLYAECLCKRMAFQKSGAGTWKAGTAAVGDFLSSLNIPSSQYTLDDGCGLSKNNAISAHLMVTVLTHDYFGPNSAAWLASLAIAGEDGTLAERFHGSDLRGRVIAKTGFVNGVSCLSGYLHAKDDNWYCFSIMFNGIPEGSNSGAKVLQERIVRAIDQHALAVAQAQAN